MRIPQALPMVVGALAIASSASILGLNIIFAVALTRAHSPLKVRISAIVASGLGLVTTSLLVLLLSRLIRCLTGSHNHDSGRGRQHTYLLAGFGVAFCVLSLVTTAVFLGGMENIADLPSTVIMSSTKSVMIVAFVVWAVSLLAEGSFLLYMVIIQRKDQQGREQTFNPESEPNICSEMQETARHRSQSSPGLVEDRESSMDSKSSPCSSGRSRTGSDSRSSVRSSWEKKVVRPISSKTRLIPNNQKAAHRPASLDSGYRDTVVSVVDGFDSWDTSSVDSHSRQTVMESALATPPRFLETIPASPTTSRSPSPGFPLDLVPPPTRKRSRSYSPANSFVLHPKELRTASPTGSMDEAHIHPLFRTDSPTPPPATTPGTIITAAPSAGQVISDRSSIRSLHRMRSGSLPSSPLVHSPSLDSIRREMEREDREVMEESGGERTLTPPIPEWILAAAPRNSITGYNSRRKTQAGLGKVGEVGES